MHLSIVALRQMERAVANAFGEFARKQSNTAIRPPMGASQKTSGKAVALRFFKVLNYR